jgi:hypothetical protein
MLGWGAVWLLWWAGEPVSAPSLNSFSQWRGRKWLAPPSARTKTRLSLSRRMMSVECVAFRVKSSLRAATSRFGSRASLA